MIESINIDLETRKQELKGKLKSWGIPESADVQMIKSSIADAEENIRVINLHQEWMMVKAILDQFIKDMEVFLQNQANLQNMKQERAALFSGGSIHVFKDKLKQDWTRITTSVLKEQNAIEKATSGIETIQQFILKENALFDAAITENGFADRAAFSLAMADLDTIDSTRKQVIDFKKRKDQHTGKSSQANAELLFLRSQDDAQLMLEELLSTEKEQKELLDKNLYEQGQIDQSLKTDAAKKQQHEGILLQLAMLEKEEKIHGILNNYIGDAQGNKFNNIVQRITMRHLFGLANIRLETLMDRYQLELGSEADEDSIWVVDMHMGDEWRTIDSVSGGERFVISLALALALSDMASQNVRIDSMFIDEGFGTLSPDDLYNAIAMLERMQVEGDKLVGIISHVESLKERIGTQILVEKLQNGESMLYLKCNEEKRGLKIKQP
jgi:exonuclease SbcC